MKQPERVPTPPVNRSDLLQPGGANQSMLNKDASNSVSQTVSSSSGTTPELVEVVVQSSDATSEVSVVAATPSTTHMTSSSINSPVMYSTTGTYNTIETYSAQSLPMTNMGYTAS